ncbi:hypothetical protein GS896_27730 [Rhodococcus hoagii]|nr:hypothetical protein [Prescottella equi]MBM4654044.1 hypothetical protein [Prescottella equi]MBM4719693.1 hypothetical protein [Prescottella equi]NKR23490.1 hypothetical protein [Prescottella equi]NKT56356.1 hypothetical protein [Prescottella equi]
MAEDFVITTCQGRAFTIRTVRHGDGYGVDDAIAHDSTDPLLEFYDRSHTGTFGPRGQFVCRYYVSSLAHHADGAALSLDAGIPAWFIDAATLTTVLEHARDIHGPCIDPDCPFPSLGALR